MIVIPQLTNVTSWEFPEDKEAGKAAFLTQCAKPVEAYYRAYAWTMSEATTAVIAANKVAPQRLAIDKSETATTEQKAQVMALIEGGCDVTILTSTEGPDFISHSKVRVDVEGCCWEGSTNFSESAWRQTNTAFQFVSPEWRDLIVAQFEKDVAWAWKYERAIQLMAAAPASTQPAASVA